MKMTALLVALCILLSGCSLWMYGSYSKGVPHTEPSKQEAKPVIAVSGYDQLKKTLAAAVEDGETALMLFMQYPVEVIAREDLKRAVKNVKNSNPFAAYAVKEIEYEFGTTGAQKAASVQITYFENRVQADKILRVESLAQVEELVAQRLKDCAAGLVLHFEHQEQVDYAQMVADYALQYPQHVMETPEVAVSLYPEQGEKQIVELKFAYRTSREELRALQNKVEPVFSSAAQYVAGEWSETEKAERLYAFLMDRYSSYHIQTSITPAYSLLLHGVGDGNAFATVYAAMCRQAEMDCRVVTGTRMGQPWVWNVLQIDGVYYHLDLLRCDETGSFACYTGDKMTDYVWDYALYPSAS